MEKLTKETASTLNEWYGNDQVVSLATCTDNTPYVRKVNAYYQDGAYYVITYGLSDKMKQIDQNPIVAVAADWYNSWGKAVSLGYFKKPENAEIAAKLQEVFAAWIDNGHNNFEDENTIILKIELTRAVWYCQGTRHDIEF